MNKPPITERTSSRPKPMRPPLAVDESASPPCTSLNLTARVEQGAQSTALSEMLPRRPGRRDRTAGEGIDRGSSVEVMAMTRHFVCEDCGGDFEQTFDCDDSARLPLLWGTQPAARGRAARGWVGLRALRASWPAGDSRAGWRRSRQTEGRSPGRDSAACPIRRALRAAPEAHVLRHLLTRPYRPGRRSTARPRRW